MKTLPSAVILRCLWRTAGINAAMTSRAMQQIGLSYVLAPALRALYPEPDALAHAFARYAKHFNTHPFMLPSYVGLVLSLETQAAQGKIPESVIATLMQPIATSFSALGDGLFSGALCTLWAVMTTIFAFNGYTFGALALSLFFFLCLTFFRIFGFFFCLKRGIGSLKLIRNLDLASWIDRFKVFNALLICLFLWDLFTKSVQDTPWYFQILSLPILPLVAYLVGKIRVPREILWVLLFGLCVLLEKGLPF